MKELTVAKSSIGIDIGGHSLKAVVAAKKGASVVIKKFVEVPISRNGAAQPEQMAEAAEELGRRLKVGSDMVVSSVSTQRATVRNLEIPFSEEDKARQILKFQTEPYLAFPIEEVIIDFYDTQTAPEGRMKVLLTAIHKGVIQENLELLSRAKIDPEVVDVDFMAVASTALWADSRLAGEAAVVIDIGSSKTVACYIQEGKLLGVRSLPLGGDDCTEAIRSELGTSFEEAERIKSGDGSPDVMAPDLSERVSRAVACVFERLGAELDRTVRYFSSQLRGGTFNRVLLCGGSASLKGLDKSLAETLSAEVSILSPPDSMKKRGGEEIPVARFATAIGLALRGLGESPCLQNFRQEEHAYSRPMRRLRKRFAVSAAMMLGILALLVFGLYASIRRYDGLRSDLDFNIQLKRRTIFPNKTTTDIRHMQELLKEEQSKLTPFRELRDSASLLGVLLDLSTRIPKDMKVEFDLFNYIKSRPGESPTVVSRRPSRTKTESWIGIITVRGTVSSVADHVSLKKMLEELDYVVGLEDKGTSEAGNNRTNFEFNLKLKGARL